MNRSAAILCLLTVCLTAGNALAVAGGDAFAPREHPSSEGSAVDAVIVTSAEMAPVFQTLADWHLKRGTRTVVKDLDWIAAHYPPGRDVAENVRFFLQDAHAAWGLSTVILGGDSDVIPARYATSYAAGPVGQEVPTDLYFACLDGDWNADGDDLWCEPSYGGEPGDDADLLPELWVGRIPVSDGESAQAVVDKLLAYRTSAAPGFEDRILFLAEVLFPSTWTPGDPFEDIVVDAGDFAHDLILRTLDDEMRHVDMFQSWENPAWDGIVVDPVPLSVAASLDSMETGRFGFVDQNGHGYRYNMSVGDGSVGVPEALALGNPVPFHLSLMNCTSTAFDFDCLGENFLRNPAGGAMAVFGTTRKSFPIHSWRYPDVYYSAIFIDDLTQPGAAIQQLRETLAPVDDGPGFARWTYLIMNFLGDPLLDLWAGDPRELSLSAPAGASLGWQQLALHADSGGAPAEGVRLTLYKDGEVWATGLTDAAGDCTLPVQPLSAGDLTLTAWGVNCRMETLTIPVTVSGEAFPHLADWQVDDRVPLDARNDADGLLEAGETCAFLAELVNDGDLATGDFDLRIESLDDSLVVLADTEALSSLAPGASTWSTGTLELMATPGTPDGSILRLALHMESRRGLPRSDTLALAVRAPRYRLADWDFTDAGNGDGIFDESEPWRAAPRWVNLGGGSGGELSVELVSLDVDLVVDEAQVTLPALELLAEGRADPGFLVRRVDPTTDYLARITISDPFGRSWADTIGFQPPPRPDGLASDTSAGADRLELIWEPVSFADLAGYHVYMTQSSPDAFARVTLLPLTHTGLSLSGLAENSLTWLYVTAVDSSGMESAPSDTLMTSTNPSQLAGFPRETITSSSTSVAVANVAGDDRLELVCAADYLYVWHHDGGEPYDGDLESETLGVYTTEVRDVAGSITLLPLIDNGYRQIVVAARDGGGHSTRGLYLLDHQAEVMPGWPRETLDWIWSNPIGADLDGDGDLEIAGLDRSGNLYAFHADGSELTDGDGNPGTVGILARGLGSYADGSPAAADLDGDGDDELVVMGGSGHKWLHVFDENGDDLPGWPVNLDPTGAWPGLKESCPLLVANLDGDPLGELEIVLHSEMDSLFVFRADGSRYPGFPLHMITNNFGVAPGPAPVDLDDDGDLELFVVEVIGAGNAMLHLMDHDGVDRPGWPLALPAHAECSPVIGDLDGDGEMEFVLGSEQGILYGFREDASVQPGFPIDVGGEIRGTPALADLDGDGDVELLASTWNRRILVWDFDGPFGRVHTPWPTLSGSFLRTGRAGFWDDVPVILSDVRLEAAGGDVSIRWRAADPLPRNWGLDRRERAATGGAWSEAAPIVESLRPDLAGWCRYLDEDLTAGREYEWFARVTTEADGELRLSLGSLSIEAPVARDRFVGAHPNPFNPSTTLVFELGEAGPARLLIYGVSGRRLRTLVDGPLDAGRHELSWDGRDDAGRNLPSGLYLARYERPGHAESRRLMLLK